MKTHSLLISFLMLLVIMGACSSGPVMRNATGFAYEIVVTMDKADWDAPAGKAIKAELTSDITITFQSRFAHESLSPAFEMYSDSPAAWAKR